MGPHDTVMVKVCWVTAFEQAPVEGSHGGTPEKVSVALPVCCARNVQ